MSKRVAVLLGGFSAEREVSLASGKGCLEALRAKGYDAYGIDVTRDLGAVVAALTPPPDAVLNVLHGQYGEDGCIQGLLEMMGVPYSGSGLLASALGMDKLASRALFESRGLPVAEAMIVERDHVGRGDPMPRPYVVKPVNQGSSVGVEVIFEGDNVDPFDEDTWSYGDRVLVERYVPGREIQVAVIDDRALGAIEIRTDRRFYDYVAKYTPGASTHLMPAPIAPQAYAEALELSIRAHQALGCRGVSRVDMRYDDSDGEPGRFVVLEVNTQPGMTPTSLVPEIAAHAGIPFPELVSLMVEGARCDYRCEP